MFVLTEVSKRYGDVSVLLNVSCKIPTDGLTVVMGPSGSGKSTLLRLLSFLEYPNSGSISLSIDGSTFDSASPTPPWPKLTCVFQKQFLWPHLTLRRNIALPLRATEAENWKEKLDFVIEKFGMQTFIDRFPNEVSGGQAQRVALARAFALEPRIILIDEPHSGLDLEQQDVLNDHLCTLSQSGVSVVVVSHSLEFAREYGDYIAVVEQGQITEVGERDILAAPKSPYLRHAVRLESSANGRRPAEHHV